MGFQAQAFGSGEGSGVRVPMAPLPLSPGPGSPTPLPPLAPLPCGPCIPIMLALGSVAAFFLLSTAVLAEHLFRRSLGRKASASSTASASSAAPGITRSAGWVWAPGSELWIEPSGTPRQRSEDWYGAAVPLLRSQDPGPSGSGSPLTQASAPPAPWPAKARASTPSPPASSFSGCALSVEPGPSPGGASSPPPPRPPDSTFWVQPPWEERPQESGLVIWGDPAAPGSGGDWGGQPRPRSPEPEWGLQPRVTLEQISAFWRREGHGGRP
ncbi:transmembrane protein C16orf54 homolog [Tachyglossus aculeatus]|uniref:transmembrane protein C16orf54 homolog n=1 Tax=Tachyglossus aculeatus TaxID=9261 RepID=UPI0018F3C1F8|nr:transmembrane protein C16orf54 homolog [Tachyglossus aculeatus]